MIKILCWPGPLHILKAAAYKTVIGDLGEVEVVSGYSDVSNGNFKDALFATPAFNPLDVSVEFDLINRYELGDWTVSTALVTAYGYTPPKLDTPVPNFYNSPAKATMNTMLTAFDKSFVEKADDVLYEILSVMVDGMEATRRVATVLDETGDPKTAVETIASRGPLDFDLYPSGKAFEPFEELGLKPFSEDDVTEYSERVSKNEEARLLGSAMVNLVTDEVTQSANVSVEDEVLTCNTSTPVDRPELKYDHIDWNKFYWADQVAGVAER